MQVRVMILDDHGPLCQLQDLLVLENIRIPLLLGDRHVFCFRLPFGRINHLEFLPAEILLNNGLVALLEGRLEDIELIRVDNPLDDVFTQPVGSGDENHIPEARFRVQGKHDPRTGQIGAHHLLDGDGKSHVEVVEMFVFPVGNRPVREKGGETLLAGLNQSDITPDIQIGVLLSRETRVGEVFRRRAGANRHIGIRPVTFAQLLVGFDDFPLKVFRKFYVSNNLSDPASRQLQRAHVVHVEGVKQLLHLFPHPGVVQQVMIRVHRDGKPVRNVHPFRGQLPIHLPKRGVFPSHLGQITQPDFIEP